LTLPLRKGLCERNFRIALSSSDILFGSIRSPGCFCRDARPQFSALDSHLSELV
jgi:hypothetical protein